LIGSNHIIIMVLQKNLCNTTLGSIKPPFQSVLADKWLS